MIKNFFCLFVLFFGLATFVFGQSIAKNTTNSSASKNSAIQIFPLSEVKEGLKGKSFTVFRGTEPEEFNVEILGVVPSAVGPQQDMIVGKIGGGQADRTFVFAGMSGSPVYVNGKLLGAIAYSFPFAKEPICGITPVEQMISIFEQKDFVKTNQPKAVSNAQMASTDLKTIFPRQNALSSVFLDSKMPSLVGQSFQPIAVPLTFTGFSQETLNQFAPQLMSFGLMPVSAVGGGMKISPLKIATENTLIGGRSVSMALSRGDYSMAAAGTVTFRDGEKIYAFGHPFLSLGSSSLPMSESHVVTVVPNINNSFKLAVPDDMVGTMTQDRNTGVFGKLGQNPDMVSSKLNVQTSRNQNQTYNFEVAKDNFLTPLLMNISLYNSITATERSFGATTVSVKSEIKIKGEESVKIERRFSGPQAVQMASGSIAVPISIVLNSGFANVEITQVNAEIKSFDGTKTADLEKISLDRNEVKAGETVEAQAFIRTDDGQFFVERIPIKIPAETPAGTILVTIGDGNSIQQISAAKQFVPKNLGDLIKNINNIKKNDRLYVITQRVTNGAIIGSKELPNLPPSVLATLNSDRATASFTPTVLTTLTEQEVSPNDYLISGQQILTIEVVK
ncbi:MAG: hypothetical protein MUC29_00425 [Pyrinomonadaceae bacterium]|nr:hypothetical protein [Pyrinomonadaceae bacterium]